MYSSVDFSITPRPIYRADGAKIFDIASQPAELRADIKKDLGDFPFPAFWGPRAGILSSQWIADAARWIECRHAPDLQLVYLPHLDYNLQRHGPDPAVISGDLRAIDEVAGGLIDFLETRGVEVAVLSEYGITAVDRPVCLNRIFRERGWIAWRDELGTEAFDAGGSRALAVVDHQIAHVYVNDPSILPDVRATLENQPGVAEVLDADAQTARGLRHERAGDFIAVADARSWFAYYWWLDDARAPDFARTIDIHRKPGYDPAELFVDPSLRWPALRVVGFLLKKKLGLRALLDVIPLDATLVRGSHGRIPEDPADHPVLLARRASGSTTGGTMEATAVYGWLRTFCSG